MALPREIGLIINDICAQNRHLLEWEVFGNSTEDMRVVLTWRRLDILTKKPKKPTLGDWELRQSSFDTDGDELPDRRNKAKRHSEYERRSRSGTTDDERDGSRYNNNQYLKNVLDDTGERNQQSKSTRRNRSGTMDDDEYYGHNTERRNQQQESTKRNRSGTLDDDGNENIQGDTEYYTGRQNQHLESTRKDRSGTLDDDNEDDYNQQPRRKQRRGTPDVDEEYGFDSGSLRNNKNNTTWNDDDRGNKQMEISKRVRSGTLDDEENGHDTGYQNQKSESLRKDRSGTIEDDDPLLTSRNQRGTFDSNDDHSGKHAGNRNKQLETTQRSRTGTMEDDSGTSQRKQTDKEIGSEKINKRLGDEVNIVVGLDEEIVSSVDDNKEAIQKAHSMEHGYNQIDESNVNKTNDEFNETAEDDRGSRRSTRRTREWEEDQQQQRNVENTEKEGDSLTSNRENIGKRGKDDVEETQVSSNTEMEINASKEEKAEETFSFDWGEEEEEKTSRTSIRDRQRRKEGSKQENENPQNKKSQGENKEATKSERERDMDGKMGKQTAVDSKKSGSEAEIDSKDLSRSKTMETSSMDTEMESRNIEINTKDQSEDSMATTEMKNIKVEIERKGLNLFDNGDENENEESRTPKRTDKWDDEESSRTSIKDRQKHNKTTTTTAKEIEDEQRSRNSITDQHQENERKDREGQEDQQQSRRWEDEEEEFRTSIKDRQKKNETATRDDEEEEFRSSIKDPQKKNERATRENDEQEESRTSIKDRQKKNEKATRYDEEEEFRSSIKDREKKSETVDPPDGEKAERVKDTASNGKQDIQKDTESENAHNEEAGNKNRDFNQTERENEETANEMLSNGITSGSTNAAKTSGEMENRMLKKSSRMETSDGITDNTVEKNIAKKSLGVDSKNTTEKKSFDSSDEVETSKKKKNPFRKLKKDEKLKRQKGKLQLTMSQDDGDLGPVDLEDKNTDYGEPIEVSQIKTKEEAKRMLLMQRQKFQMSFDESVSLDDNKPNSDKQAKQTTNKNLALKSRDIPDIRETDEFQTMKTTQQTKTNETKTTTKNGQGDQQVKPIKPVEEKRKAFKKDTGKADVVMVTPNLHETAVTGWEKCVDCRYNSFCDNLVHKSEYIAILLCDRENDRQEIEDCECNVCRGGAVHNGCVYRELLRLKTDYKMFDKRNLCLCSVCVPFRYRKMCLRQELRLLRRDGNDLYYRLTFHGDDGKEGYHPFIDIDETLDEDDGQLSIDMTAMKLEDIDITLTNDDKINFLNCIDCSFNGFCDDIRHKKLYLMLLRLDDKEFDELDERCDCLVCEYGGAAHSGCAVREIRRLKYDVLLFDTRNLCYCRVCVPFKYRNVCLRQEMKLLRQEQNVNLYTSL